MTAADRPTPIMVLDAHENWPPRNLDEVLAWVGEQGIEPNDTTRIEIYLLDCLYARVYQNDKDENGKLYCPLDHDHRLIWGPEERSEPCEVAQRKPFDVLITSMPPTPTGKAA